MRPDSLLLWITAIAAMLGLAAGVCMTVMKRRGYRFRKSPEQQATEKGLAELSQRCGTRWGAAGNADSQLHESHSEPSGGHGSSQESAGD